MEELDICGELNARQRRPPLRSMLSEPAEPTDDHNDLLFPSHTRQDFNRVSRHEFHSVSYRYQFDQERSIMLNFALSPSQQSNNHDRKEFDRHFSPLIRISTMKPLLAATSQCLSSIAKENGGSLTPARRRSSGAYTAREQLANSQGSVFYTSPRSTTSFMSLVGIASPPTPNSMPHQNAVPPATSISPQSQPQTQNATKHRLKAILTVDSKTTEILIANDNVKRVFGLVHFTLIGKRLTEVFSSCVDGAPPAILHNQLFSRDGKLRPLYGKAVDVIDATGKRGTVCVWSYPLTHAAAAASERPVLGKPQMVRVPSAVLSSQKHIAESLNYNQDDNVTTPVHRCGLQCKCSSSARHSSQTHLVGIEPESNPSQSVSTLSNTPPTTTRLSVKGGCSRAIKVIYGLDQMVEGGSSPLKDSVIDACCSHKPDPEMTEKHTIEDPDSHTEGLHRDRGHITNGAAARRWLILMEPINALSISCTLGAKGRIFRVDDNLAILLGYVSMSELLGTEIVKLIPAVNLETESDEQHVCALGVRGNSIPITVRISAERDPKTRTALMYEMQIRALSAVNGVVTLTESGIVHSFNENFIEALVGKECKENAANNMMHITDIIPQFHTHIHTCGSTTALQVDDDDATTKSSGEHTPQCEESDNAAISSTNVEQPTSMPSSSNAELSQCMKGLSIFDGAIEKEIERPNRLNCLDEMHCSTQPSTSDCTELDDRPIDEGDVNGGDNDSPSGRLIREGTFYGLARHSDASMIAVRFDVRRLESGCPANWAVCIGYDRSSDFGLFGDSERNVTRDESNTDLLSCGDDDECSRNEINLKRSESIALACVSLQALEDENAEAVCGEYSQHYDTFQLIGNGTFGSVKLAARKDSGLLAVAKFICKSKVLPEGWVPSPQRGNRMVPIELHLLETLSHPNIVQLLDVYENETYYQLVMQKLGCGMDLFEFIDHQPKLDEPLMSYIFRQIVSAVAYLHSNSIVHRDVKDENVIIDQNFCCKLIDFGSAAFFGNDIVFSTFCGTMEYCSPEVLSGNKYLGPELEMWSLGILLYTLVYFENPFRSPQETVQAEIELPWDVSDGLFQVIAWLLHRDPRMRATVNDIKNHCWLTQPVDTRKYKFQDMLKSCERAQFDPPLYVSELANHLKNASSCSALVIDVPTSHPDTVTAR